MACFWKPRFFTLVSQMDHAQAFVGGDVQPDFIDVSHECVCPICLSIIQHAKQLLPDHKPWLVLFVFVRFTCCRSGDKFCDACITTWLSEHDTCPCCRAVVLMKDIKPDPKMESRVWQLKVKCPNAADGCLAIGERGSNDQWRSTHRAVCAFEDVVCRLASVWF